MEYNQLEMIQKNEQDIKYLQHMPQEIIIGRRESKKTIQELDQYPEQNIKKGKQLGFDCILKHIKKLKNKRNNNVLKHLLRLFLKNVRKYFTILKKTSPNQSSPEINRLFQNKIKKTLQHYKNMRNLQKSSMVDIENIFGVQNQSPDLSFISRKILSLILVNQTRAQKNNQICRKKLYMMTLKIQNLRCRNPKLISRLSY